jgi:hypothetical protein
VTENPAQAHGISFAVFVASQFVSGRSSGTLRSDLRKPQNCIQVWNAKVGDDFQGLKLEQGRIKVLAGLAHTRCHMCSIDLRFLSTAYAYGELQQNRPWGIKLEPALVSHRDTHEKIADMKS